MWKVGTPGGSKMNIIPSMPSGNDSRLLSPRLLSSWLSETQTLSVVSPTVISSVGKRSAVAVPGAEASTGTVVPDVAPPQAATRRRHATIRISGL
jgi:hypothetical protein